MAIDLSKIKQQRPTNVLETEKSSESLFAFLNKDISFSGNKLNDHKKESFYHELAILLQAGVDIRTCFEMIKEEQSKLKDQEFYELIAKDIVSGKSVSEAIKSTGKFTPYEYYSLQIGEETGRMVEVLQELASYYQKKIKQRRLITSAMTYPIIVLCTAFGAIFFMMNFIVPMFADVFKRFGGDLPYLTKVIVNISEFMSDWFLLIFAGIISLAIVIYKQRKKQWFRKYTALLVLKLPIAGALMQKVYLARFCHSMTLLLGSKIPLLRAISLTRQMIDFYPMEISLDEIEAEIMKGTSLNKALSAYPIYPKRMISLLKVGEEVNQLENFFDKIAKQYSDEVEYQTSRIGSMIEPLMIIFLGVIVGVILIAMYLPLFSLSSAF